MIGMWGPVQVGIAAWDCKLFVGAGHDSCGSDRVGDMTGGRISRGAGFSGVLGGLNSFQ